MKKIENGVYETIDGIYMTLTVFQKKYKDEINYLQTEDSILELFKPVYIDKDKCYSFLNLKVAHDINGELISSSN